MSLSKQSDVNSKLLIETEYPTVDQLRNFNQYILQLEKQYHEVGAVILDLPSSHRPISKIIDGSQMLTKIDTLSCMPVTLDGDTIYEIKYDDKPKKRSFKKFHSQYFPKNIPFLEDYKKN